MPRRINCKPTTQQDEREGGVPWEGTETAGRREMYKEESEVKERGKGRIYKMEEKERKKKKRDCQPLFGVNQKGPCSHRVG